MMNANVDCFTFFLSGACGPASLCEDADVFLKLSVGLNVIRFCNQSNEYVAMHFHRFRRQTV